MSLINNSGQCVYGPLAIRNTNLNYSNEVEVQENCSSVTKINNVYKRQLVKKPSDSKENLVGNQIILLSKKCKTENPRKKYFFENPIYESKWPRAKKIHGKPDVNSGSIKGCNDNINVKGNTQVGEKEVPLSMNEQTRKTEAYLVDYHLNNDIKFPFSESWLVNDCYSEKTFVNLCFSED